MSANHITYRLVVKESLLRERYDALLATLQDLHFESELLPLPPSLDTTTAA